MTALSLLDRFADAVLRYRWPVLGLAGVVMLAVTAGAGFVAVTNDYRSLFDEDNPQLAALNALEDTYGPSNRALIAIAPANGPAFTRETLAAVEELTEAAWKAPYATRVDSLTNYSHSRADGDALIVEPLVEGAGALTDADLKRIAATALNAVEISGRLVSRDGKVAGLVIDFALPDNPDAAVVEITDYLNGVLDEARARDPGIAYYLTGDVPLNRAFADATRDDLETLAPIVFAIIAVMAAVLLRSLLGTAAIVAVLMFVINTTVGFAGWIGTVFNPANSGVPIIVMTVAVAHSVHIVETTLAGLSRGLDRNEAIAESIRVNAWPVFLTSLTTVIGFLSLNASDSPPFRVLGNLVAFGVFCAFVYSLTLLPALLSILPMRARKARGGESGFFDRFGRFVVARRTVLLWCSAVVAIVLVTGVPRLELTDNWTRYLSERYQFRQDSDFVIDNLTGIETLEYSLKSGREDGITDPAYLRKVEAFASWFRTQPEVSHVQAFPDIMKRLNKNMNGDDPDFYRVPEDPDLSAQYLLLYELSLPFGRDLNNRIDIGKSATRMTVVMRSLTSQGAARTGRARPGVDPGQRARARLRGVRRQHRLRASLAEKHREHAHRHHRRHGPYLADPRLRSAERARRSDQSRAEFHSRGNEPGPVGLHGRPRGARRFGDDRDRLRHCRRRYDPFPDQVPESPRRRAHRPRGRAERLPDGRACAVDHDRHAGSRIPGVRLIRLRDQLGARPAGHAHDILRAAGRFSASPAPADGARQEEAMIRRRRPRRARPTRLSRRNAILPPGLHQPIRP